MKTTSLLLIGSVALILTGKALSVLSRENINDYMISRKITMTGILSFILVLGYILLGTLSRY